MPYRRAVAATWRGACKLSRTILSFSPSDQRRRRPVSTTSSRSTWALRLSLSIRTVLNSAHHLTRRPSAEGYPSAKGKDFNLCSYARRFLARTRPGWLGRRCPLFGVIRKWRLAAARTVFDPQQTPGPLIDPNHQCVGRQMMPA